MATSFLPAPEGQRLLHRIWLRTIEQTPLPSPRTRALYHATKAVLHEVDMLRRCGFPSLAQQSEAFLRIERAELPVSRYGLVDVPGQRVQAMAFPINS